MATLMGPTAVAAVEVDVALLAAEGSDTATTADFAAGHAGLFKAAAGVMPGVGFDDAAAAALAGTGFADTSAEAADDEGATAATGAAETTPAPMAIAATTAAQFARRGNRILIPTP